MKSIKIFPYTSNARSLCVGSEKLFNLWRSFDLFSAGFSLLGIVFSSIDYEINYSYTRTYANCEYYRKDNYVLRYLTLVTTLIAIFFLLMRYWEKIRWKNMNKHNSLRNKNLVLSNRKNLIFMLLEIIILLIIPYPMHERNFYVPIRYNFKTFLTCYTVSEILYCLMFLRTFLILRALVNYSKFQNERAQTFCQNNGVKANLRFLAKCLVFKHPIYFVSAVALVSLFVMSLCFRVLERPVDDLSGFYYNDPTNAIWFTLENMIYLGYGDFFSISYPGRVVSVIAYCAGSIVISIVIASLRNNVEFDRNQAKVFNYVMKIPESALIIKFLLRYYIVKKKYGSNNEITLGHYKVLKEKIAHYKKLKSKTEQLAVRTVGNNTKDISKDIKALKFKIKEINKILTHAISKLQES
jgi:hypothetical protein